MAYSGITKSRKNTSGRKSVAARQAEERERKARTKYKTSVSAKKPKAKTQTKAVRRKERPSGLPMKPLRLNPRTPIQLPETSDTRKGMNIKELMQFTPKLFVNNSKDVIMVSGKKATTRSGMPAFIAETLTRDPYRPDRYPKQRTVHFIGLDKFENGKPNTKKPLSQHRRVLVQCSCEAFTFYGFEYANALKGASRIIYGNGDAPDFTNPGYSPGLCKHAYAIAYYLLNKNI